MRILEVQDSWLSLMTKQTIHSIANQMSLIYPTLLGACAGSKT